jgi:hypothetical protein
MQLPIDVLVGNYDACVRYNMDAIRADRHMMICSPATAGCESFYFGYIAHNVSDGFIARNCFGIVMQAQRLMMSTSFTWLFMVLF